MFLGLSISVDFQQWASQYVALLVFIGAVFAHVSVNTLNEYHDFKSGLDLKTDRTQFSGGSGALPGYPNAANLTLIVGILSLFITVIIGLYLVFERGELILPIGALGVGLVILYTKWINRMPVICLLAPGLGFGIFMVVGTSVVTTGEHSALAWLVSLVPFFLANNLLLLNQYPDIGADSLVGRRTFPIVYGIKKSNLIYALFVVLGYSTIVYCLYKAYIPLLSIIALIPIALSLYALQGAMKYSENIGKHPKYLGANVAAAVLTPLLLATAITNG
ncbi:prenyltransferase [Pseudomonadota bacterium]